jgi:hypothetical protein
MPADEALTQLGVPVPDSALARRARGLITDVAAAEMAARGILEEIAQAPFDS